MRITISLLSLLLILACTKKEDPIDMEMDFYPIVEGNYIVYKAKEIHIDINSINPGDTLDYFVKAKIGDTIIDNQGRIARRYERYYGPSATGPWNIHDVWTTVIAGNKAELVEENNRLIKLVFKPTEDKEWNCNTYTILDPLNCYYTNLNESYSLNGLSFSNTIIVEQEDELNFIEFKRKYERYAKGVGMIYKCYIDFDIINGNPNNVKKGDKLILEAVTYGHE